MGWVFSYYWPILDEPKAIGYYRRGIEQCPHNNEPYERLSDIYLRGGKMIDMRRTSEKKPGVFPFDDVKVPIILIGERTILIANGIADKIRLIELADKNACILLAAWPGRMRQDIFLLDNRQYALSTLRKQLLRLPPKSQRRKK